MHPWHGLVGSHSLPGVMASSISSCLWPKFNWPFVPAHGEWARPTSTNRQSRALIGLYLSCPVLSLQARHSSSLLASSFISLHVSLLEVMYFTKLLFTCPCHVLACSRWLAFIHACPVYFKHSTFPPLHQKAPPPQSSTEMLSWPPFAQRINNLSCCIVMRPVVTVTCQSFCDQWDW